MAIKDFDMTTLMVLFILCFRPGISDIILAPSSRDVQLGGSTYFNCSTSVTSKEISWFHYPVSSSERSFVFSFGQFYAPFLGRSVLDKNATSGVYNLVITSIVAGDAGKFECQDDAGAGMKKSAHLVVLETDLVCQSNVNVQKVIGPNSCDIEPDQQLILSCMVQYKGNEAPIMQWLLNDQTVASAVTGRDTTDNRVFYNLTMKTQQISNGSIYVCQTTRSTSIISCKTGEIKVVGSTHGQGMSNGGSSNCKPYEIAIVCICVLLLLPLCITVAVLIVKPKFIRSLKLRAGFKTASSEEQNVDEKDPEQHSKKVEESESTETQIEATNVKKPLLSKQAGFNLASSKLPTKDDKDQKQQATNADGRELTETQTKATAVDKSPQSKPSGEASAGSDSKLKKLEDKVRVLNERLVRQSQLFATQREEDTVKITSLQTENRKSKAEIASLQLENDQLQSKVKELEQQLYLQETVKYADKPTLSFAIELKEKAPINGIAILGEKLFVVTKSCQEIQIYDSKTYKPEKSWTIEELTHPLDIASSKAMDCLYIFGIGAGSKVIRLNSGGKILTQWPAYGGKGRLSTYEFNVILCLSDKQSIYEYSEDGELILQVSLSPAAFLNNPLHAIKVTSTCFIVSHGDVKDELHRVCAVDLHGNVKKECRELEKSRGKSVSPTTMKVPVCLMNDRNGSIIVADEANSRILLLSSTLTFQGTLIASKQIPKGVPVRMCFDDTDKQLFVAVNKWSSAKKFDDCRIMIFSILGEARAKSRKY